MSGRVESFGLLHEWWFGPAWPYACLLCGRRIPDPNQLWCEACPVALEDIVTRQVNPGRVPEAQGEVLRFVDSYIREKQISPSLDDIGLSMGYTRQAAHYHVRALAQRKLLQRNPHAARAITVTPEGRAWLKRAFGVQNPGTTSP